MSCLIEDGNLLERGGVNFSHVTGNALPPSATAPRPELAGRGLPGHGRVAGAASAQPLRAHGAHERALSSWPNSRGAEPVWWFGGGMDLTPYYGFEEDAVHFHRTCRDALAPFGPEYHPQLQEMVRRVFLSQASQGAARHRRHVLR